MVPTCLGERPGALRRMPAGSPTPVWCIVRAEFFRGTGSSSGRDVSMSCIGNRSQSIMSKLEGGDDSMFCTRSCPRSSFPSITAFSEAGEGDGWSFRDPVCFDFKTFDSVGWSVIRDRGFSERVDGSTFCKRDCSGLTVVPFFNAGSFRFSSSISKRGFSATFSVSTRATSGGMRCRYRRPPLH